MKKILLFVSFIFFAFSSYAQDVTGTAPLVINEVDYDIPQTDTTEFIEIKNLSSSPIDLSAYAIILYSTVSNPTNYDTIYLASYILQPGQYYVICGSGNYVPNCNQTVPALSDFIQNGPTDGMAIWFIGTASFLDALSYEGNCATPFIEGTGVVSGDNGNSNQLGLSRFPDGTDGNNNDIDFSKRCITPGATNASTNTNCDGTVGIEPFDYAQGDKFSLYPNPANDFVTISTGLNSGDVSVLVYDFTGKLIENKQIKNAGTTVQYTTSELANGVYILSIKTSDKTVTKKLTVLHR